MYRAFLVAVHHVSELVPKMAQVKNSNIMVAVDRNQRVLEKTKGVLNSDGNGRKSKCLKVGDGGHRRPPVGSRGSAPGGGQGTLTPEVEDFFHI